MDIKTINSIIDDIAHDAKVIISEHLLAQELAETLEQSAKDWDEVGRLTKEYFKKYEDAFVDYIKNHPSFKRESGELAVGDEIVFIGNGCAVTDRVTRVLVETSKGYQVYFEDACRSMDELVERLKKRTNG